MKKTLVVPSQQQANPYWCWAAVASMVSAFYKPVFSQCQVATMTLQFPNCDCCGSDPAPDACQTWWDLPRALGSAGHYRAGDGPGDFSSVVPEIDQGNVLCALMQYRAGPRHYLLLVGYDDTPSFELITVIDPATRQGNVDVPAAEFFSNYDNGKAYWDSWVFTKH